MKAYIGPNRSHYSWQAEFPLEKECVHCKKQAELAFVTHEDGDEDFFLCNRHENEEGNFWFHDVTAFATYICRHCAEATTVWNQG